MSSYKCRFCGEKCNMSEARKDAPPKCLLIEGRGCAVVSGTFSQITTQKPPKMFRTVKYVFTCLQEIGVEKIKDCRVMWGVNTLQAVLNFEHCERQLELKILVVGAYGTYACNISLLDFHGKENMRVDVICEPTNDFSWALTQIQEHLKELLKK